MTGPEARQIGLGRALEEFEEILANRRLDEVAQSIQAADSARNPTWGGHDSWDELPQYKRDDYLAMAAAAIVTITDDPADLDDLAVYQKP